MRLLVRLLNQKLFAHKGIVGNLTASTLHLRESRQISDFRLQILDFQLLDFVRFQIPDLRVSKFRKQDGQIPDSRFESPDLSCLQIPDSRFHISISNLDFEDIFQI